MNAPQLYLGKARKLLFALIFAMSAVLILCLTPLYAEGGATNTCVNDESNPGIQLTCEGEVQYILIDAAIPEITFDVAMPLGTNRHGVFGECKDVNFVDAGGPKPGPGCNSSAGLGYPLARVDEFAARFPNAVIAVNGDLFGYIGFAYGHHGPEGLTIVNGLRIDGNQVDHGTVGDDDGEAVRRPSMIIRGDGADIDIDERTLIGIQMLTDSLNQSTGGLEAMGGCPLLVKNGEQLVTEPNHVEVLNRQNCSSIRPTEDSVPRTAVGVTTDGKLLIMVAPGSANLQIWEVAERMKYRFVKNAIGLDGGGSTQLWYASKSSSGQTLLSGSRRVANALVVSHSQKNVPNQCTNPGFIQASATQDNPCIPTDRTAPTASSFDISISGGYANITTGGVSDSGGSGVARVNFSAKWSGEWHGIGSDSTSPYSLSWNMCAAGVPDGSVEFGMEVLDAAGNKYVWSEHSSNPIRTKSFNCDPNSGSGSGSIKIYAEPNNGGRVIWAQNAIFSNEPNAEGYALEIPNGWSSRIWSGDNRSGDMRCFSSSVANLQDHGWNNRIQSIEGFTSNVCGDAQTGLAVVCADGVGCWQFGPGYYPLPTWGWNDIMTEIYALPSNMSISMFRDTGRTGSFECENSPRVLPSEFYKQVTDMYVHMGRDCAPDQHQTLIFYDGRDFSGYAWAGGTKPGSYNITQFGPRDKVNDKAYSLRIPNGKSAWFYADDNRGGEDTGCWTGDHPDLGNWKNKISSFELFDNTSCTPEMPSNLNGAPLSDVSIQLWWGHIKAADYRYKIYKWNGYGFSFLAETQQGETAYIDNDVFCGADYFYKVSTLGRRESNAYGWIKVTTMSCPPPGVPGLPQEYVENGRSVEEGDVIVFEWTPSGFAYDYQAVIGADAFLLTSGRITANTWTVRDLPPNLYGFGVAAFNRVGQTQSANYLVEVTAAKASLLAAEPSGCDGANLYWKNNSKYTGSFIVRRGNQKVGTVQFAEGQEYYSFTDAGLSPLTSYSYRIETMPKEEPNSSLSNEVQVQIPSCAQAPEWARNVRTAGHTATSMQVLWDDSSDNETGFVVWQWIGEGYQEIARVEASLTSYTVSNLTCQTEYHFAISAFNDAGQSALNGAPGSTTQCPVDPPPPPAQNRIFLPLVQR